MASFKHTLLCGQGRLCVCVVGLQPAQVVSVYDSWGGTQTEGGGAGRRQTERQTLVSKGEVFLFAH